MKEAAGFNELVVATGDQAFPVGAADDGGPVLNEVLGTGDGKVAAHDGLQDMDSTEGLTV